MPGFFSSRSGGRDGSPTPRGGYPHAVRGLRGLLIFQLGVWTGMAVAGAFVRRAMPSRGDEESDELSLVAVFDGVDLKSRARAFRGGSMVAWNGGIKLDLRDARIEEKEAVLHIFTLMGGLEIQVPTGWIVEPRFTPILGGYQDRTARVSQGDQRLVINGTAIMGTVIVLN